jgi:hypothetical protein
VPQVFQQAMQLMRRRDPQARESGFALAREHAAELVDELIAEFAREQQDPGSHRPGIARDNGGSTRTVESTCEWCDPLK